MSESESILVLTTCKKGQGAALAQNLVKEGLAACVNIVPAVESVFVWNGAVQTESEELLLIKTSQACYEHLEERIKLLHSYEVPEILSLAIRDIYKPYQDWLLGTVTVK